MKNRNEKFVNWITKHQIHIFDRQLGRLSALIALPLMYLLSRLLDDRFDKQTVIIIVVAFFVLFTAVLQQIIGIWISKRPTNSNWRNY